MLNLWGLEGPLAPPLDGNFGFSELFLRFGGRPYPRAKLQVPRTPRSAQTFISSVSQSITYNRLYSILTRASRSKGRLRLPKVQCGTCPGPNIFAVHHISGGCGPNIVVVHHISGVFDSLKIFPC